MNFYYAQIKSNSPFSLEYRSVDDIGKYEIVFLIAI